MLTFLYLENIIISLVCNLYNLHVTVTLKLVNYSLGSLVYWNYSLLNSKTILCYVLVYCIILASRYNMIMYLSLLSLKKILLCCLFSCYRLCW